MSDLTPRFIYDKQTNTNYEIESKSVIYLINNLANENWRLRGELTELKLVMGMIIEDLEKTNQYEYAEWIKKECNTELPNKI